MQTATLVLLSGLGIAVGFLSLAVIYLGRRITLYRDVKPAIRRLEARVLYLEGEINETERDEWLRRFGGWHR